MYVDDKSIPIDRVKSRKNDKRIKYIFNAH